MNASQPTRKYLTRQVLAYLALPLLPMALMACADFSGINTQASTLSAQQIGLTSTASTAATTTPTFIWPEERWWTAYGDVQLDKLVDQALAQNPTLKLAQARITHALASAGVARSTTSVQLSGAVDSTYQHFTKTSIYPPPLGGAVDSLNNANLQFGYDVDFFGHNRAALNGALGQAEAARADAAAARIVLAANVAKTYFRLARLDEQKAVAESTLKLREQTRKLVLERVTSGLDTRVELRQAEGGLPEARLEIAQLDEQIALTRNALAALLGAGPDAAKDLAPKLTAVRSQTLPETLPADLVGRRADLAAARARVKAAAYDIDASKAQFYPNVNLIAFAGFGSIGYANWFKGDSRQYGVGPAISIPIFAGGRLRAELSGKTADYDAAVESYNQTVLEAVREVADQLTSLQSLAVQTREQGDAQAAAESAYELALKRYQAGLTNYLTVLTAENTVLSQRRQAVDLKARLLEINVNLNRALGGGYADPQSNSDKVAAASNAKFTQ